MNEQENLAVLRTLYAYERNVLSVERTQLAQLRTGITIALIAPSAIAAFTYAFDFLPKDIPVSSALYILLVAITVYGAAMVISAYAGLRKTRKKKRKIRERERELCERIGFSPLPTLD
ncbi:MAG: hypothetical protein NWE93_10970 [Candidatus Bathyarchaeota archaeon]|nr:hypothetical protein [Candidatus Bathyarchaeota archaeon]